MAKGMKLNRSTHNPWEKLKLSSVINAAGKMTYLGGSAVQESVAIAMAAGASSSVEMKLLKEASAKRIAELAKAPSALIVASGSAGIVQSVASCITGENPNLIAQVPNVEIAKREILIQKPHAIDYGVPVTQLIRLGGGVPIEIGSSNRANKEQIASAISANTAAIFYIVSHHVQAECWASLEEVVAVARKANLPVIVDAAAESDLSKYLKIGASLVVYSGHKAIGAPTSGLILGESRYVKSCAAQEIGVGRAMKVSKEAIAGLLVALDKYTSASMDNQSKNLEKTLKIITSGTKSSARAELNLIWDETRPIPRLEITFHQNGESEAKALIAHFKANKPAIWTRNHKTVDGIVGIDPRELSETDAEEISVSLNEFLKKPATKRLFKSRKR